MVMSDVVRLYLDLARAAGIVAMCAALRRLSRPAGVGR